MGRRKNAAHKSVRMPVTRGLSLRSRVPGNWHARFCSRDGGSDSLVYCNLTPGSGVLWLGTASVAPAQVKRGVSHRPNGWEYT